MQSKLIKCIFFLNLYLNKKGFPSPTLSNYKVVEMYLYIFNRVLVNARFCDLLSFAMLKQDYEQNLKKCYVCTLCNQIFEKCMRKSRR